MSEYLSAQKNYRYQNGVRGRGLTPGRRALYFARLLIDSPVLISEWPAVRGRRSIKSLKAVQFMNDLCNATNGKGLDVSGRVLRLIRKSDTRRFDSVDAPRLRAKAQISDSEIARVVRELRTDGFSVIRNFVTTEEADLLRQRIESSEMTDWQGNKYSSCHEWLERSQVSRGDVSPGSVDSIVRDSTIDLASMDLIARSYLQSAPIRIAPQSWITTARDDVKAIDYEESAMSFHCDSDFMDFFKMFLILTDVGPDNGPFTFVRGSHRGDRQVQGRVADTELAIDPSDIAYGTGQRGDLVIACTIGWHKASPVRTGHRTMIQWLYSTSLFGRGT